jgi:hypothetical protein
VRVCVCVRVLFAFVTEHVLRGCIKSYACIKANPYIKWVQQKVGIWIKGQESAHARNNVYVRMKTGART